MPAPPARRAPVADVLQHQRADEGYGGRDAPGKPGGSAVQGPNLPFRYTPHQVRHRLGHGDLTTTTRYVKILDEEDPTAADVMSELLKAAG